MVFSVRIRADLKEKFTRVIREKGYSTCSVVEPLLEAWLIAQNPPPQQAVDQGKTIVINQNFTRVVKRARRKKGEIEEIEVPDEKYLPKPAPGHAWCWSPKSCAFYIVDV